VQQSRDLGGTAALPVPCLGDITASPALARLAGNANIPVFKAHAQNAAGGPLDLVCCLHPPRSSQPESRRYRERGGSAAFDTLKLGEIKAGSKYQFFGRAYQERRFDST
jgi:hypothetical protein